MTSLIDCILLSLPLSIGLGYFQMLLYKNHQALVWFW
jgi:hypothetical protein